MSAKTPHDGDNYVTFNGIVQAAKRGEVVVALSDEPNTFVVSDTILDERLAIIHVD